MQPFKWNDLVKISKSEGYKYDRTKGSHYIMTKEGAPLPIVIPKRKELDEFIVFGVAERLGLDRQEMLERLNKQKGRKGHKAKK